MKNKSKAWLLDICSGDWDISNTYKLDYFLLWPVRGGQVVGQKGD